jgi:hypothetical protein
MSTQLASLHVGESHPLHDPERIWVESNCYVDVWIELLHALGLDPVPALAFTLSCDFEGDQWTFHKFPLEDLRLLYGVEVGEMNAWLPLDHHIEEHLGFGRVLVIEVDSWYLPDTHGISYRTAHTKTSIAPVMLDRAAEKLGYFHGTGYFELEGDDFRGALRLDDGDAALPPYVELVKIERLARSTPEELVARAEMLARDHLARRPPDNPVHRMRERLAKDMSWLSEAQAETFHGYAFATLRQCGSSAELAATFVDWLAEHTGTDLSEAAAALRELASTARAVQFKLARLTMGKTVDVGALFDDMEQRWDTAMERLAEHYGS